MSEMVLRTFNSKKNMVRLISVDTEDGQQTLVAKTFSDIDMLKKESEISKTLTLAGLRTPQFMSADGDTIFYEYINSDNLCDILFEAEKKGDSGLYKAFRLTIDWLIVFFYTTGFIMNDVNLRNFLYDGRQITGVDFEESAAGIPERDFGKLLAFTLTYEPEFTHVKKSLVQETIAYIKGKESFNTELVDIYLNKELRAIRQRRNGVVNEKAYTGV